jgi:hypothetical protein
MVGYSGRRPQEKKEYESERQWFIIEENGDRL